MRGPLKLLSSTIFILFACASADKGIPRVSDELGRGVKRSVETFVKAGEDIFKGKCANCHYIGPKADTRCPDLENVGSNAATRKPGMTAKEYFIESLYRPEAYVVKGYPNIMPPVWKPPIALSNLETAKVIAFLQSQGGEVDITPFEPPVDTKRAALVLAALERNITGDPKRGEKIFKETMGCLACHGVKGEGGQGGQGVDKSGVGPDLTNIGAINTIDYIEESILYPNAQIVKGFGAVYLRSDKEGRLEGILLDEDKESVTLKIGEEIKKVLKSDIKVSRTRRKKDMLKGGYFWVSAEMKDGTTLEGSLIAEDDDTLTIEDREEPRTIAKDSIGKLSGRRMRVRSKMPGNYGNLLYTVDFNHLLAYLVSLKE